MGGADIPAGPAWLPALLLLPLLVPLFPPRLLLPPPLLGAEGGVGAGGWANSTPGARTGGETSRGECKRSHDRSEGFPAKSLSCRTPPPPQASPHGVFTESELFCVNIATWWPTGVMGLTTLFLKYTPDKNMLSTYLVLAEHLPKYKTQTIAHTLVS